MKAHERNARVTIELRTEVTDGQDGFAPDDWTAVEPARRSARVQPLTGRDLDRAQQIDPRISHQVTFGYWRRYRTELAGGRARLVYHPTSEATDDRVFEIVGPPIDLEERHDRIIVYCREAA